LRDQLGTFLRSEDYIVDVFCMAIVDVIIGQRDHKWHNSWSPRMAGCSCSTTATAYMKINSGSHRTSINSRKLGCSNLSARLGPIPLERRLSHGFRRSRPSLFSSAFAAIPDEFRRAHDACLDGRPYVAASMFHKQEWMKANLGTFRRWASTMTR